MGMDSLGMSLERRDSVRMWVSRCEGWACLVIRSGETNCEIRMDRVHVEALRDHVPDVLAGMDRWAAEDAVCEKAEMAGEQAVDAAAQALDRAVAAEAVGAHDVAASLRAAAAMATASAEAVDTAVEAVGTVAADADCAVDSLTYVTREAETALRRLRDDGRPADLVER